MWIAYLNCTCLLESLFLKWRMCDDLMEWVRRLEHCTHPRAHPGLSKESCFSVDWSVQSLGRISLLSSCISQCLQCTRDHLDWTTARRWKLVLKSNTKGCVHTKFLQGPGNKQQCSIADSERKGCQWHMWRKDGENRRRGETFSQRRKRKEVALDKRTPWQFFNNSNDASPTSYYLPLVLGCLLLLRLVQQWYSHPDLFTKCTMFKNRLVS